MLVIGYFSARVECSWRNRVALVAPNLQEQLSDLSAFDME